MDSNKSLSVNNVSIKKDTCDSNDSTYSLSKNASLIEKFCEEVLEVYDKHDIDGHINWKKKKD